MYKLFALSNVQYLIVYLWYKSQHPMLHPLFSSLRKCVQFLSSLNFMSLSIVCWFKQMALEGESWNIDTPWWCVQPNLINSGFFFTLDLLSIFVKGSCNKMRLCIYDLYTNELLKALVFFLEIAWSVIQELQGKVEIEMKLLPKTITFPGTEICEKLLYNVFLKYLTNI